MAKISKNDIDEYWKYMKLAGSFGGKIEDRITHVLKTIYKEFGAEIDTWYFDDAPEGDVGSLHRGLDKDIVSSYVIETKSYVKEEMIILLDDGTVGEFGWCFPTRWLYEDFEKELTRGKAAYEQQELDKKRKAAEKKADKKAKKERLKASAASKLTAEEKKALGLG